MAPKLDRIVAEPARAEILRSAARRRAAPPDSVDGRVVSMTACRPSRSIISHAGEQRRAALGRDADGRTAGDDRAATRCGNRTAACSAIAPPTAMPASATFSDDAERVQQRDQIVRSWCRSKAARGSSATAQRRACRSAARAACRISSGTTRSQLSSVPPISWISTSVRPAAAHVIAQRHAVDLDEVHEDASIRQRDRRRQPAACSPAQSVSGAPVRALQVRLAETRDHLAHDQSSGVTSTTARSV